MYHGSYGLVRKVFIFELTSWKKTATENENTVNLYMEMVRVTCAIIELGAKVLVVQRSEKMKMPLKWEFPGGKIEPNESEEDCIIREIREELDIKIEILNRLSPSNFRYPTISVQLIPFISKHLSGVIKLKEHNQFLILRKEELIDLDWAEADISIVKEYMNI